MATSKDEKIDNEYCDNNENGDVLNNVNALLGKRHKGDKKKTKESRNNNTPRFIARIFGRWKRSVCMAKNGHSTDSLSDSYAANEGQANEPESAETNSITRADLLRNVPAPGRILSNNQILLEDVTVEPDGNISIVEDVIVAERLGGHSSYPHVSYSRSPQNSVVASVNFPANINSKHANCNLCFFNGQPFSHGYGTDNGSDANHSTNSLSRNVHTQIDYIHYLVPDLLQITKCGFYWGVMDRYEAERLLNNKPEGTFLLRDSAQEEFLFSVSFRRYGRSLHARIEQLNHLFSFDSHDVDVFASPTVCKLIEHYKDPTSCMFFEPMLLYPLNRSNPFSLQHLCRAMVCSKIGYDNISNLPLPGKLKEYLRYYHYKQKVHVRHFENS